MTTDSTSSFLKTGVSGKLDKTMQAVCDCGRETKLVTFRNLKNKWPHCKKCNQPMKVKSDAIPTVPTSD